MCTGDVPDVEKCELSALSPAGVSTFPTLRARNVPAKLRAVVGGHADQGERRMVSRLRAGAAACVVACALFATGAIAQTVTAIEYHHTAFDHYFITIDPGRSTRSTPVFFAGWTRAASLSTCTRTPARGSNRCAEFFSTSFGIKSFALLHAEPGRV